MRGAWIEIFRFSILPGLPGSLPVRGAWIEMPCVPCIVAGLIWSLPVRGAWIEIVGMSFTTQNSTSLPVRGAWIEITVAAEKHLTAAVAPRAGSVD